jgi:antitoxin (DNA-binding transcriptional repressor) of toxin-antitoxin stability system
MVTINIHEAKTHLSKYARLVKSGETVILCDRNVPFAEWRPLPKVKQGGKRKLGQLKGQCPVGRDFFGIDREIEALFAASPVAPLRKK